MDYPILEFDSSSQAFIEPHNLVQPNDAMPPRVVICFFQEVITALVEKHETEIIHHLGSEMGRNPVYAINVEDQLGVSERVALFHPGVGAPLAGAFLEEAIVLGGRQFIACGGAGALNPELVVGHLVIPTAAVRDEGLSYHYLPPAREAKPDAAGVAALEAVLAKHDLPYVAGKTWTTDAIYRETPAKIARRREEGCLTVEMEAASFFAVAQFRGVSFAQLLYAGDDLSGDVWDHRDWLAQKSTRERLFWLAAEAALQL